MGCHCLLRGIFLTQRSNSGLLNCKQILYPLSRQGSGSSPGSKQNSHSIKEATDCISFFVNWVPPIPQGCSKDTEELLCTHHSLRPREPPGPSLLHFQPQDLTLSAGAYQLPSPQGSCPAIQLCSVRLPFKVMISETPDSTFLNILIFIHVILWPKKKKKKKKTPQKVGNGCGKVSTCVRGS